MTRLRQQAACLRSAEQGLYAKLIPDNTEELADEAFLAMAKLRDRLALTNRNIAACGVDRAMEALEVACREFVR